MTCTICGDEYHVGPGPQPATPRCKACRVAIWRYGYFTLAQLDEKLHEAEVTAERIRIARTVAPEPIQIPNQ